MNLSSLPVTMSPSAGRKTIASTEPSCQRRARRYLRGMFKIRILVKYKYLKRILRFSLPVHAESESRKQMSANPRIKVEEADSTLFVPVEQSEEQYQYLLFLYFVFCILYLVSCIFLYFVFCILYLVFFCNLYFVFCRLNPLCPCGAV